MAGLRKTRTLTALRLVAVTTLVLLGACADAGALPSSTSNTALESFAKAKKLAAGIYADRRETFYCGCTYDERGMVDHESCGYVPMRDTKRSHRIEWEHVVPAEAFGRSFPEWRDGHRDCVDRKGKSFKGRNCARKASSEFRRMEADLYNLVPAIGEVNARRQNFSMAMLPGEERLFGTCDVEISGRKIEPRPAIRGGVARIYLYMDSAYPKRGIVSKKNRKLFGVWATNEPPDEWECRRARRIAEKQPLPDETLAAACAGQ